MQNSCPQDQAIYVQLLLQQDCELVPSCVGIGAPTSWYPCRSAVPPARRSCAVFSFPAFMKTCVFSGFLAVWYRERYNTYRFTLFYPVALADKRDVLNDFKKDVSKYLRLLRTPLFGLERAADWLEDWVNDRLQPLPLLDVSAR